MGSSNSKPQSRNPAERKSLAAATQFVAEHGVAGIGEFYRKQLETWKDEELNFLVTGNSGSGKSTFINAIRNLDDHHKLAAKVGVVETTKECTPYPHPDNPKIIFWDVPGIGTPNFPNNINAYCRKIDLEKYDACLFLCMARFTENDLALVKEAKFINKPFFFIRAHVKTELKNTKRSMKGGDKKFNEKKTLTEIRNDCYENLQELLASEMDIFLIDNYVKNKWDFERLIAGITDVLPERRRDCFIFSLSNVTRDCLKRKAKVLRVRAGLLAVITAPASAIPVPVLGAVIDLALIIKEVAEYRKQFGLPADDSEEFEKLDEEYKKRILRYSIKTAMQLALEIGSGIGLKLGAEEVVKYIPFAGTILATAISAGFMSHYLICCIDEMEEVALQIWDRKTGVIDD